MRGGLVLLCTCAALLFASGGPAAAQPGSHKASDVEYGRVDDATLRVFAIGSVGVETVPHGMQNISVATPVAGHGSGFGVGSDGMVVTAAHVVNGATHVVVRLPGEGGFVPARVAYMSEADDVAILHVPVRVPVLNMAQDTDNLRVRQTVYAIGYPIDPSRIQPQSAKGIVAGNLENGLLQLDMALNPGNSGGPLVDEGDVVIGMVVARGSMSAGIQGIGYAVGKKKIDGALAAARSRLRSGMLPELGAGEARSAALVDELILRGALRGLGESTQISRPLTSAEIQQDLDAWTGSIEDPDLLAFVSGSLWNAYLALEFGNVRQLGNTSLSDPQARALAKQLRRYAIRSSRRAAAFDASVKVRSPFVEHVLSGRGSHESIHDYASGPDHGPFRRLRVAASVGYNGGPSVGGSERLKGLNARAELLYPLRSLDTDQRRQLVALLGAARGYADLGDNNGATSHGFTSYELGAGVVQRIGDQRAIGAFLSWAPGTLRIEDESGREPETFSFLNARMSILLVGGSSWTVGAGVRAISDSGWWTEWFSIGLIL